MDFQIYNFSKEQSSGYTGLFNQESPSLLPQFANFNYSSFSIDSEQFVPECNFFNQMLVADQPPIFQNVFVQQVCEAQKLQPANENGNPEPCQAIQADVNEESTKEPISSQVDEDSEFKDKSKEIAKEGNSINNARVLIKKHISKRNTAKESAKNYDKNICRYLTRCTIRQFMNEKYQKYVLGLCNQDEELYDKMLNFFTKFMEKITGFRVLSEFLIISEKDSADMQQYKIIFKKFLKFFLKERIIRYIMKGKMDNKLAYIKYKNEVMLKYLNKPEKWVSNKNKNPNSNQF